MRVAAALAEIAARLAAAGIEQPRREARILLGAAAGVDAAGLLLLDEVRAQAFEALLARRERREPLAYILGRKEFWGLEFEVSPASLIPRPESETLIEAALAAFPDRRTVRCILDLGTGSGCLLLAALAEFPGTFGVGVDLAPAAARLAQRNAARLGLRDRAGFVTGDWAAAIGSRFDLILSNPPYIRSAELPFLMPEVGRFEPPGALAAGADGLDAYRAILRGLPDLLSPAGVAVLELGQGQEDAVRRLAGTEWRMHTRPDLAGIARALVLTPQGKYTHWQNPA